MKIQDLLKPKIYTHGIVVFFEPDYLTQTIKEIGRTESMEWFDAVNVYSETPNPASQMIEWDENIPDDKERQEEKFNSMITDQEFLQNLFECI